MFTVKVVFLVTQIILFVNIGPGIKADWTVKNETAQPTAYLELYME